MAWIIPGVGNSNQGVVKLWDVELDGYIKYKNVSVGDAISNMAGSSPSTADFNTIKGVGGSIVTSYAKYFEKLVDCSAGGTAQSVAIVTLPAGSTILEVSVYCSQAFNGNATKTFEVGLAANTDKYIDPVDCPVTANGTMNMCSGTNNDQKKAETVGASTAIVATWTNTAAATTGKMVVRVIYV